MSDFVVHCKKAPYDVYIGRPSKWGNPFKIGVDAAGAVWSREGVIDLYRAWLYANEPQLIEDAKRELRGKVLGCWCSPQACHGDVLAEIANEDSTKTSKSDGTA